MRVELDPDIEELLIKMAQYNDRPIKWLLNSLIRTTDSYRENKLFIEVTFHSKENKKEPDKDR